MARFYNADGKMRIIGGSKEQRDYVRHSIIRENLNNVVGSVKLVKTSFGQYSGKFVPNRHEILVNIAVGNWRRNFLHELGHFVDFMNEITMSKQEFLSDKLNKHKISKAEHFAWDYAYKKEKEWLIEHV